MSERKLSRKQSYCSLRTNKNNSAFANSFYNYFISLTPRRAQLSTLSKDERFSDESDCENFDFHRPRCPWARRQSYVNRLKKAIVVDSCISCDQGNCRSSATKRPWLVSGVLAKDSDSWSRPWGNKFSSIKCFCTRVEQSKVMPISRKACKPEWVDAKRKHIVKKFDGFSKGILKISGKLSEETICLITTKIKENLEKHSSYKIESVLSPSVRITKNKPYRTINEIIRVQSSKILPDSDKNTKDDILRCKESADGDKDTIADKESVTDKERVAMFDSNQLGDKEISESKKTTAGKCFILNDANCENVGDTGLYSVSSDNSTHGNNQKQVDSDKYSSNVSSESILEKSLSTDSKSPSTDSKSPSTDGKSLSTDSKSLFDDVRDSADEKSAPLVSGQPSDCESDAIKDKIAPSADDTLSPCVERKSSLEKPSMLPREKSMSIDDISPQDEGRPFSAGARSSRQKSKLEPVSSETRSMKRPRKLTLLCHKQDQSYCKINMLKSSLDITKNIKPLAIKKVQAPLSFKKYLQMSERKILRRGGTSVGPGSTTCSSGYSVQLVKLNKFEKKDKHCWK